MFSHSSLHKALRAALARLMRPLVRMLLRNGFPYEAFEAVAKKVYVDVAMEEFTLPGRKPSISRASILTGLTRKDVQGLLAQPVAGEDAEATHYNRAARVLTAWVREPDFRDERGEPARLEIDGERGFSGLVRRHSGDMPMRAVLDELLRVGAVHLQPDGRVELRQRAFVPNKSAVQKLAILGTDVSDLIETIDHNIEHGTTDPRFQRKVMHVNIPVAVLPAFRDLSAAASQALLEELDAWLSAHDVKRLHPKRASPESATARVGVGIHYFEQLTT